MIDLSKITRLSEWQATRKEIESAISAVVGKPPVPSIDLQMKIVDEIDYPGYSRKRVNFFVSEWERATAWLFVPEGKEDWPAILCCHDRTPYGKDEAAGLAGNPMMAFARHYAELGYITIAPDVVTAGERVSAGLAPYESKRFYKDNPKISIVAKMLADHMMCVDVLAEVKNADPSRIGVIGHGLGAINALLLAAFEPRVQACVASCGITSIVSDPEPERLYGDNGFVLLPKLKKAAESQEWPFDWDHVLALAAPSPTLTITASNDDVLANTKSCETLAKRVRKIYKLLGAGSALENLTHNGGRTVTRDVLDAADEWFERWL